MLSSSTRVSAWREREGMGVPEGVRKTGREERPAAGSSSASGSKARSGARSGAASCTGTETKSEGLLPVDRSPLQPPSWPGLEVRESEWPTTVPPGERWMCVSVVGSSSSAKSKSCAARVAVWSSLVFLSVTLSPSISPSEDDSSKSSTSSSSFSCFLSLTSFVSPSRSPSLLTSVNSPVPLPVTSVSPSISKLEASFLAGEGGAKATLFASCDRSDTPPPASVLVSPTIVRGDALAAAARDSIRSSSSL
mmetsp:Transcript_4361/g.15326  ORF Transcript_4361/g.15326 Transcript_4361/m.15326 type:complete len:250 (+) Transcript_4361:701-1450(+)